LVAKIYFVYKKALVFHSTSLSFW